MFAMLYVTHPDEDTAKQLADRLLTEKLIACANTFPIQSAYWWEGAVQNEREWVSILKTTIEASSLVERRLLEIHPYDTPCVIKIEVSANAAYEEWVASCVHPERDE